jgi:hypothetical protein
MIARISDLFSVDIEVFMGNLQATVTITRDLINTAQTRRFAAYDLSNDLGILSNRVCILETILSLIKRKAQRFRPNNIDLHQALADIEKDIKSMGSIIWMTKEAYQRDPNFAIDNIYKAITDIGAYANNIRLKMNTFIQEGLFA